jgi:hypothetical protein
MEHSEDEPWVQLATRVPKALHQKLRLHCVTTETSLMNFVTMALREKLTGKSGARVAARGKSYGRIGR